MSAVDRILGEYIDAWKTGERPDLDAYLARVPAADRDDLAEQVGTWLQVAPTPDYPAAARASIAAEPALRAALREAAALRPPPERLEVLRERAGLGVGDVAARLAARFGFADQSRAVAYLERLERGELDASRVSRRLLDALSEMLGAVRLASPAAAASQALFRADEDAEEWIAADIDALSRAALAAAPKPMDELDRLFLGGPDG